MANQYFKRRLRITLTSKLKGNSIVIVNSEDVEKDLIVKGKVNKYPFTQMDECDLTIYNLNPITRGNIIAGQYFDILIEAGYFEGNFGTIYEGFVLRAISGDQDATTTITRFICTDSSDFRNFGFINATFEESANFYQIAKYIAENGDQPVTIELDERLKNFPATGGRTLFGSQYTELQQLADDAGYGFKVENNVAKLFNFDSFSDTEQTAVVLNANTGMLGIPTLTDSGVEVRALLNPTYRTLGLIKLNNADIRNEQDQPLPNRDLGAFFSTDGLYKIIKLTFVFDNEAGAFQTYITALSRNIYESLAVSS